MNHGPLSAEQIKILGIVRTKAYAAQMAKGLIRLPTEVQSCSKTEQSKFWAHQIIAEVTQRVASANDLWQDEYKPVLARFEALAGETEKAFADEVRVAKDAACHRAPGCEYVREMNHWLAKANYKFGYATAIMFARFKTRDLTRLKEFQLKQLHDTVVNRCRAKLGLGDDADRNKKQRAAREAKQGAGSKEPGASESMLQAPGSLPAAKGRHYALSRTKRKYTPPPQAPVPDDGDPY